MKIESKHNSKIPAYAIGAAALSAAILLGGCNNTVETTELQLDGAESIATESTTDETHETTSETDPVKDTLADIGENYYKEVSPEDVVIDEETGLQYAKNQLLVSCSIGTPKEEMEKVCEEIGAEIVGYTEITSDFQIEFKEDKTLDDLDEITEYLYGYPFVSFVSLNTVSSVSFDG